MYPNPQEAAPLPHATPAQYEAQAEDLVRACKSNAIRAWAARWVADVAALEAEAGRPSDSEQISRRVDQLDQFARAMLSGDQRHATCALTDAQFVIARAHGFVSWAEFAQHLESLADADSPIAAFEAAADAIVAGDMASLERLLRAHPVLIRSRSMREHRATLLHYVSANGVEHYRQKTPQNAAAIARMLLQAGAEIDAEADVYGGGCATLGLVATSVHPFIAGVQRDVIDVLLEHGARMDHPGSTGTGMHWFAAASRTAGPRRPSTW